MQTTHKIARLPQPKQVLFSQLLKPICSADDPQYDYFVLKLAEQVKAEAEAVIAELTAPTDTEVLAKEDAARPTVVGIFKSPIDKRFLVFTSTHEAAVETARKPLTLDPAKNGNHLVRSWNSFVEEQKTSVLCTHHIPDDQRTMYGEIYAAGKEPLLEVVEVDSMTRIERSKARQRYAAKLTVEGYVLGSQSWN